MSVDGPTRDAILRIGEVSGVDGRRIYVLVDKGKNLSDMFFDGDILKNISVNSFVEIRKGFLSIIGRVEGEKVEREYQPSDDRTRDVIGGDKRILTVSLAGYIDEAGVFIGGTKELPLIGNEAYVVTRQQIHIIHNLVRPGALSVSVATNEEFEIEFPVDGLFNSHIAIFGNTGSGKSNTLAALYQALLRTLAERNEGAFMANTKFVLFDFNGEYTSPDCIADSKTVYNLSTRDDHGDRLPFAEEGFLDVEVLSTLAEATDKTQKPFINRALRFLRHVFGAGVHDPYDYLKNILRNRVRDTLQMSDKVRAFLLIDYFREILPAEDEDGAAIDLTADLEWHNVAQEFRHKPSGAFLAQTPARISDTLLYGHVDNLALPNSFLARVILFLYLQLIADVIGNRAQNEHIAPVINRLKGKRHDVDRLFDINDDAVFWQTNFVVVNMDKVNLEMKKTLPLLLSKKLYTDHKRFGHNKTLTIIVDEAHNILSTESFREAESWKDYRLETFEEIIKEGRKFGVFLTVSSQRPNDISPTITSQAHNYFIHRLINERDLKTIASAVSYIDKVTEEAIPTLPTGTCVFSGVAGQMPLKISIRPLNDASRPKSSTRCFTDIVPAAVGGD